MTFVILAITARFPFRIAPPKKENVQSTASLGKTKLILTLPTYPVEYGGCRSASP